MTRTTCSSSMLAPRRPLPQARPRVSTCGAAARGASAQARVPTWGPQASGRLGPEALAGWQPHTAHECTATGAQALAAVTPLSHPSPVRPCAPPVHAQAVTLEPESVTSSPRLAIACLPV